MSRFAVGQIFFALPNYPEWLWSPSSHLFKACRMVRRP